MKIAHFYHVWASGAWSQAVQEHQQALMDSGFPVTPLVGVTGNPEDREVLKAVAGSYGWQVIAEADEGYEQLTLDALRAWALSGNDPTAVLYAHTKGARTDLDGVNSAWRRKMTARMVGEWRDVQPLLEHHDAVGCCWKNRRELPHLFRSGGSGSFMGNFWWATRRYVRGLPEPGVADRHDAEEWVGLKNPDVIDMLPGWLLYLSDGSIVPADMQYAQVSGIL